MGAEVYMIILGIGIVTFFFLRWIFKRFIKTDSVLRVALTWIGTVILTPIIYLGLIGIVFSLVFYNHGKDLVRKKWFIDKEKNIQMRETISKNRIFGKRKGEILELLGPPSLKSDTSYIWIYDYQIPEGRSEMEFNRMILIFENDRVSTIEKKIIQDED